MNFNINFIELAAVLAAASSGIIEARDKKMDIVGVFFVAFVTALGGGSLRDVLLGRSLFWLRNELYPMSIFLLSVLALLLIKPSSWNNKVVKWSILLLDAGALAMFSIVGCQYALEKGCALSVCVMMGVITGTFGGVIRDILCNEIPRLFQPMYQLYATCSFIGSVVYTLLVVFSGYHYLAAAVGIVVIFLIRLFAILYNLKLPRKLSNV